MNLAHAFGTVLKRHRKKAGLSQEELAHRASMHSTAISLYERGLRQPNLHTVFVIADKLGISSAELVKEVEDAISED
jgi:transcriptional regulator with XRE-family HTH domain